MPKKPKSLQTRLPLDPPRSAPQMPEGYYSGDRPNPNLRAFVEAHLREKPYDPETDAYDVPAFDRPIEATKATAIYNMHSYHQGKKPHDAIREYIRHYTEPGGLVLDPFCGSGSTALAALMEGRKAIAIDRSPAATFITKNYCTPVDPEALQQAFEELKAKVQPEMDWLYETKCDRCGGKATTSYTVYSQVFQCPRCLEKVPLFDCVEVQAQTAKGEAKTINACPHCHALGFVEELSTRGERFGAVPVLVRYECLSGCKPARSERRHNDPHPIKREYFEKCDLEKIREIESKEIPHWYPRDRMMHAPENQERWGAKWRAGTSNFRTVDELYTKRSLWALAAVRQAISNLGSWDQYVREALWFTFSGCLFGVSRMLRDSSRQTVAGTYYIAQVAREIRVPNSLEIRIRVIVDARREADPQIAEPLLMVSSQSATSVDSVLSDSVDYIFTDPPYGDRVQYGELNFVREAWLGLDTHWHDEEIIVNEVRGKTSADWAEGMRQAMAECHRVLKPGRWISLCYHDTSEGTWSLLQDIMAEAGFLPDTAESAVSIDTSQKSYNQITADKVTKRDLVINFRKPKPGEVAAEVRFTGDDDAATIQQKVLAIIRDYLEVHPGTTRDRVYDEVVSRLVRRGQMEAHDFEALLAQAAVPVQPEGGSGAARWFLRDADLAVEDAAESAKEAAAAAKLRDHIGRHLVDHPAEEGVHYSDLFEQYVYAVSDKARRRLAEWLPDYFPVTPSGTYRLPMPEEEKILAAARAGGLSRRIKRYVSLLESGAPVPPGEKPDAATLAEWIRHCARTGLYPAGRTLYESGGLSIDALSEESQVAVEEDYGRCVRGMARK